MRDTAYHALLASLAANEEIIEVNGVTLAVRNCHDRVRGKLDPRTQRAASATREEFRQDKSAFHPALHANEDKLFGPERLEFGMNPVNDMRFQFGWRSVDLSEGVAVRRVMLENKHGEYTVWHYKVPSENTLRPCLVFIHGGGFAAGDTATVENQCKLLAQLSGAVVLSVDYPLAPEHPYPAGFDTCYDTVKWAFSNAAKLGIDPSKIGVSGDSAGGNLSLACVLRDRDEHAGMIRYQALIYPLLSRSFSPIDPYYYWAEDLFENSENDPLIAEYIRVIGRGARENCAWYVPEGVDRFAPYISPIAGGCESLPQTLLVTAEYDFLRAECDAYLGMLAQADVPVRAIRYGGIPHGTFDRLGYAPQVEDILIEIAKDLRAL